MPPGEEWKKESKFVLKELTRLADVYESLRDKVNDELTELKTEVAILKVKAGIWGLIGGIIAVGVFYLSRNVGG